MRLVVSVLAVCIYASSALRNVLVQRTQEGALKEAQEKTSSESVILRADDSEAVLSDSNFLSKPKKGKKSKKSKKGKKGKKGKKANEGKQSKSRPNNDDSAMQKNIQKKVGEELEARMKFYPGMTSAKQLLVWNSSIAGPRIGPAKSMPKLRNGPRMLSMHDMATGYNEMSDNDYLMMFKSWEVVDIFVYFSHVHIAVPPVQWTMTAHQHGRPALGTLIFEWDKGTNELSQAITENREQVLDQLVKLADHYGFDGWFFNNEGGNWDDADPEKFVGELRDRMHKQDPKSMVIAYPYTPMQKDMFAAADGVFVNYNWDESDKGMQSMVDAAGNRTWDVYMGMDSFGSRRGNDEPDPIHMKECAKYNLSAAVFGPGYTLEIVANKTYSDNAVTFDRRYWSSIAENFGRPVDQESKSGDAWPLKMLPPNFELSLSITPFKNGSKDIAADANKEAREEDEDADEDEEDEDKHKAEVNDEQDDEHDDSDDSIGSN